MAIHGFDAGSISTTIFLSRSVAPLVHQRAEEPETVPRGQREIATHPLDYHSERAVQIASQGLDARKLTQQVRILILKFVFVGVEVELLGLECVLIRLDDANRLRLAAPINEHNTRDN